jgi:5-methyltetrahydropteroyltriglutamate--homocysteine methyltransferase
LLFPTTIVGSFPQPEWLIDRAKLAGRFPPRVRARELWRLQEPYLAQAQDDATLLAIRAQEDAGLDYADAVNAEIKDKFAAGADVVQIDEPYMQARPQKAREYGLAALNRALEGVQGTTCVHICFGYAAIIHERPSGYSFLPELAGCSCRQVSIETAQSQLDTRVLRELQGKQVLVGCIDLSDPQVETPEVVAGRVRRALEHVAPEQVILAPDCGMKYLPREVAQGKLAAMVQAARQLRQEYGAA